MSITWRPAPQYISDNQRQFGDRMAELLDFDIVVTSATRTPKGQAEAMFGIIQAGDPKLSIYSDRNFADEVAAAYPNLDKATDVVIKYASKNPDKFSHQLGLAIDFRTIGLTQDQIDQMIAAAKSLGGRPLVETNPPHLHVSFKKKSNLSFITPLMGLGAIAWILLR